MKINPTIRKKRINEIQNLYDLIIKNNETYKECIYTIIKETINNKEELEKSLLDIIYKILEETIAIVLTEVRKMYKTFDEDKIINLKDMLYNKDGKTLEERISGWVDEKNIMNLFFHICLILDTETFSLIPQTIKKKVNVDYVEIIGEGDCDICAEYCDGEVYKEDEIELPLYHPGCKCEVVPYEQADIL